MKKIEHAASYAVFLLLAAVPTVECVLRLVLHIGIPNENLVVTHLLLVLGLFAGMRCSAEGSHLSIGIVQYLKNEKARGVIRLVTDSTSVFITTIIAWSSLSFIKIALQHGKPVFFFLSDAFFALSMPIGYIIIAIRFAIHAKKGVFPFFCILLGTLFSFPAVLRIIWGFDLPDSLYYTNQLLVLLLQIIKTPAVIFLFACAMGGMPLFTVIGGLSLLLIQAGGGEIETTANQIYTALTNDSIIAVPLFTLTGFFLSESRAGERLVATFRAFFGWLPGGLIILSVIICAFFTSFTGASGVTILALGGILFAVLTENSAYKDKFSVGLLASSGSIGLLFPPSIPILLVAASAQVNTLHFFLGGIMPGILLTVATIIAGLIMTRKKQPPRENFVLKKALVSLKYSFLEILLPIFLIAGYFLGILSTVEISAVSVLYVFVVEVLVHRDIPLCEVKKVLGKALPVAGGILSILALAGALSYYIVDTQAPQNFARWMAGAVQSKIAFLLILNLALLIVGCFIDIFSAILVVLPLILPLGAIYGIDPVHLGIIFLLNLEAGFLTPPLGLNLFFASYRFKRPFVEVCRDVLPFLLIQLVVLLLVTFVPFFSTFLKNLL